MFSYSGVSHAQMPPATSQTLRVVEQRGRLDVQAERQRATIQALNALYGYRARAEGISLEQVPDAYGAAYAAAKPPASFWNKYGPRLGWVTAIPFFFLFLFLFRDAVRDVLGPRLKAAGDRLYDRVAGYPVFWWKARGNYRKWKCLTPRTRNDLRIRTLAWAKALLLHRPSARARRRGERFTMGWN